MVLAVAETPPPTSRRWQRCRTAATFDVAEQDTAAAVERVLARQKQEFCLLTAKYLGTEEYFAHKNGVVYEELDSSAKETYIRKLNELTEAREEVLLQQIVDFRKSLHKRKIHIAKSKETFILPFRKLESVESFRPLHCNFFFALSYSIT